MDDFSFTIRKVQATLNIVLVWLGYFLSCCKARFDLNVFLSELYLIN